MSMVPRAAIILACPINLWDEEFEDFIISDVHEQNYFGKVLTTVDEHSEAILLDDMAWTYDEIFFTTWENFTKKYPEYKHMMPRKWLIFQWD